MRIGILKFITIIGILVIFLSFNLLAEGEVQLPGLIFEMKDPVGDDWGPGYYTYPKHQHFQPFKGLFDLTRFAITDIGSDYLLEFDFGKVDDPWNSKFGFSHPLIQIYIDNLPGGSVELFRPGARLKLDEDAPWDVMLNITGWWVRAFRPSDRAEIEEKKIFWNDTKNPFDLEQVQVNIEENVIKIQLAKKVLGDLKSAKLFLLVGAFEPFAPDYFREITEDSGDWIFGGSTNPELDSRVLDILVPEGMIQEDVLKVSPDSKDFATVSYINIAVEKEVVVPVEKNSYIWLAVLIVVGLLFLIVKMKSKKDPISQ
ncbi:MAG: hypothetical protein KAX49_06430 [Halanaerobiales bacterium]|nr:hypothetical protein [Halanaerobiales bacterium]